MIEPAHKRSTASLFKGFWLALLLALPFLPYLFVVSRLSYIDFFNSSDSFLYLDIAKNIASGRGFITSLNSYQYWNGVYYPAVPFVPVVFPLVLAGFSFFLRSVQALTFVNFLPAYANAALIYCVAQKLYSDKSVSLWAVLLIILSVSMEVTLLRILTDQWSLCVTLVCILIFLSDRALSRRTLVLTGFLLGAGILLRPAAVYYPLVFLPVLFRQKITFVEKQAKVLLFLCCSFLLPFIYEVLIYAKYKVFFPQYPQAFRDYCWATFITGGYFSAQTPVIRPFLSGNTLPSYVLINIFHAGFILLAVLRVVFIFSVIRVIKIFKNGQRGELLLLGFVILQTLSVIGLYPYLELNQFEMVRFLFLPVVFLALFGVQELRLFVARYVPNFKAPFFYAILSITLVSNFYQTAKTIEIFWQEERSGKSKELTALSAWLKQNTSPKDLIAASEFVYGGVYLERPIVALPDRKTLNNKDLAVFIGIYGPRVVIFEANPLTESQLSILGYKNINNWYPSAHLVVFTRY